MADLVRRAHEGEVLGEALFARLAESEDDADRRRMLAAARLLEAQTRLVARDLASSLGVDVDGGNGADEARAAGERTAEALARLPWGERMGAVAAGTGMYRSLYEDLAAALGEDHGAVQRLLAHERALHAFAESESASAVGDGSSLDALLAELDDEHRAAL